MSWKEAYFSEAVVSDTNDRFKEDENLMTWSELVGKCGSEQMAMKAIERGDADMRAVTDRFGKKREMFAMVTMTGTII